MPTVASLHIHPVKSCRGHDVAEATLDAFGLVGDRRFLVVDERGHFLTQRTLPRLAHVVPEIDAGALHLTGSGVGDVTIPLGGCASDAACEVVIWRDTVRAVDLGPAAAAWLTQVLGRPARLVRMAPGYSRPIRRDSARPGDEAAFSDAFPLLILSEASLAELNGRLDDALPMNRFRPNLVVAGCEAYAEDAWRRIRIGDVVLRAAGACARCIVTTTDQRTLERGKEPLRTLAQYRRSEDGLIYFGQNYIHETKSGRLEVGAPIEILA